MWVFFEAPQTGSLLSGQSQYFGHVRDSPKLKAKIENKTMTVRNCNFILFSKLEFDWSTVTPDFFKWLVENQFL
jgi:hypothetical protein